jgi:uncharacterized secreted protein with C-terminal beta-propeller domain
MDGAGFVHTDPPADPESVVGEARIAAADDYVPAYSGGQDLRIDVLSNDQAPAGSTGLRIKSVSATAKNATAVVSADGQRIIYTAPDDFTTWDSFYYIVTDAQGNLGKANVIVGRKYDASPYSPPTPVPSLDDTFHVFEDSGETVLDVLRNDGEFAEGEIVAVTAARIGEVRIADDGRSLIFQPDYATTGYDNFYYTVRDAAGDEATGHVTIGVRKPFSTSADYTRPINIDSPPITLDPFSNDYQLTTTPLEPYIASASLSSPRQGQIEVIDGGRRLRFTPAPGFIGHVSYSYTVKYGPENHQHVVGAEQVSVLNTFLAVDDWTAVAPGSGAQKIDVLRNDLILKRYGLPSVSLDVVAVGAGSHGGHVEIAENGRIAYTPAAGFTGDETFTYTVRDSTGHVDSAVVTVHVAELPAPEPLPRFTLPGELEQFLVDLAVKHYASQFGRYEHWYEPVSWLGGAVAFDLEDSSTNVQETGVDEADVVETDGRYLYTLADGKLAIVDLEDPANPRLLSKTSLGGDFEELYLMGDRVALVRRGFTWSEPNAALLVLDVTNRAQPVVQERTEIDGHIVDSRAVGHRIHIAAVGLDLPEVEVLPLDETNYRRAETLDEYVARVRSTLINSALPNFRTYGADGALLREGLLTELTDIHKPVDAIDGGLLSLATFDVADGAAGPDDSVGVFAGNAAEVYMSGSSMYVLRNDATHTAIFKFTVDEHGAPTLAATGRVNGVLLNQFSADEHDGRLRIATTRTETEWWSGGGQRQLRQYNNLYVLEQHGAELTVVGRLENLAPTETIKSVRFLEDRAYVVTFRVVDPLFVIDLTDPTLPTVEGSLKIPGFSDYLHPIGEDYVIGIGRDASEITGALGLPQVSLFYVGDGGEPVLVDQMSMEGADWAHSEAWSDHHAVAFFADAGLLTLPINWNQRREIDDDDDGVPDRTVHESHSSMWAFEITVDQAGGGAIELAGKFDHASGARRSVLAGDALITVSDQLVKVHDLADLSQQLAELYVGPLSSDDFATVAADGGPTTIDVRSNDRPVADGAAPRIVSVTQPTKSWNWYWWGYDLNHDEPVGAVEIASDGSSVVFTPAAGFIGTATFTYTIFDPLHGEETATVTVSVTDLPDPPVAVDDEFHAQADSSPIRLDVLANDLHVDGDRPRAIELVGPPFGNAIIDQMTIDVESQPTHWTPAPLIFTTIKSVGPTSAGGVVTIDASARELVYQPSPGFAGVETFTYTIKTTWGATATATVTVRVTALPSVAVADPIPERTAGRPQYRPSVPLPELASRPIEIEDPNLQQPAAPQELQATPPAPAPSRASRSYALLRRAAHDQALEQIGQFDRRLDPDLASALASDLQSAV